MAETSNPDALVRIVGARCEKCDHVWEEGSVEGLYEVRELERILCGCKPGALPTTAGQTVSPRYRWRTDECAGRLLLATEPANA